MRAAALGLPPFASAGMRLDFAVSLAAKSERDPAVVDRGGEWAGKRGELRRVAEPSGDVLRRFDEHPWEETVPRLLHHARSRIQRLRWLGEKNGQPPRGVEPTDVVQTVIEKVLAGTRKWNPDKHPDLLRYLLDVVDSEVSNLVTLSENVKTQRLGESDVAGTGRGQDPGDLGDARPTPAERELEREAQRHGDDFAMEFWASLAGEPDLQEVVEAIIDDVAKPAEIAARVGVRPDEIYARRKRLKLRLAAFQEARRDSNRPKGVVGRA